mmetsp:Transcript_39322/g.125422  ORF Transcript_39322/g.125422 Transcript_39322/m.125422 type:complete len:284 (+) Transcript_39322:143-994(+)
MGALCLSTLGYIPAYNHSVLPCSTNLFFHSRFLAITLHGLHAVLSAIYVDPFQPSRPHLLHRRLGALPLPAALLVRADERAVRDVVGLQPRSLHLRHRRLGALPLPAALLVRADERVVRECIWLHLCLPHLRHSFLGTLPLPAALLVGADEGAVRDDGWLQPCLPHLRHRLLCELPLPAALLVRADERVVRDDGWLHPSSLQHPHHLLCHAPGFPLAAAGDDLGARPVVESAGGAEHVLDGFLRHNLPHHIIYHVQCGPPPTPLAPLPLPASSTLPTTPILAL